MHQIKLWSSIKFNDLLISMSMGKQSITFPLYRKGMGLGKIKKAGKETIELKVHSRWPMLFTNLPPRKGAYNLINKNNR